MPSVSNANASVNATGENSLHDLDLDLQSSRFVDASEQSGPLGGKVGRSISYAS